MKHSSTSMQATAMTYPKGKSNRILKKKRQIQKEIKQAIMIVSWIMY